MKLIQTSLVYLISIALATATFHFHPFAHTMPPWETCFDYLGLFWSMTLSCSLTLFALLSPSAWIAGIFQKYECWLGLVSTFLLTFVSLLAYYISSEGVPDYTFQIAVSFIVAILVLLPFILGYLIKTQFKNTEPSSSVNHASLGG